MFLLVVVAVVVVDASVAVVVVDYCCCCCGNQKKLGITIVKRLLFSTVPLTAAVSATKRNGLLYNAHCCFTICVANDKNFYHT